LPFVSIGIGSLTGLPVSLVFSVMAIITSSITAFVGSLERETLEKGYDPEEVAEALRSILLSFIVVFLVSLFLGWALYKTLRMFEIPGLSLLVAIIFFSLIYIITAVVALASTWHTESSVKRY
jgi:multisubunit Na+/H+ antiporter MnhB subunit